MRASNVSRGEYVTPAFQEKCRSINSCERRSQKLKSHRNILGYYSKVFAKVFDESSEIPVRISVDGFEVEIVKAALEFLHGKFDAIKGKEKEVQKFAEIYEIEELKTACYSSPKRAVDDSEVPLNLSKIDRPCRPMSAYMCFLTENRERLRKPGMGVTDVTKAVGIEWKNLKDKTKYKKMAEDNQAEISATCNSPPKSRVNDSHVPKKVSQKIDHPKKPVSAFCHWMTENRDRIKQPGMGLGDVAVEAGRQWKNLEDKTKWEKMAEDDKTRYQTELSAACNLPAKRITANDLLVPNKFCRKIERPSRPMSAFFHWMGENRAQIRKSGMGPCDVAKEASIQWKNIKDKTKWEKMAEIDKNRYVKEMDQFLNQ